MLVLGIDPGITTGWGLVSVGPDQVLSVQSFGMTKDQTLLAIQDSFRICDLVVIESFLTRPKNARAGAFDWDPMETSQVIGAAKVISAQLSKPIHEQPSSLKPVGYGWMGKKYVRGKRNMHAWDALAHAVYYLVKNAGAKPVGAK